jgi:HEAT repeat protein
VAPERSVPWLRERLRPVVVPNSSRTISLIDDLKSDKYGVRERAGKELEALADGAAPALRKALEGAPSLELRRRVERLLGNLEEKSPERLRDARAVEVLERIANEKAVALLRTLASGASEALLTREARAALRRLETRRTER